MTHYEDIEEFAGGGRVSPQQSATSEPAGTLGLGNDGNIWINVPDKNGRLSWKATAFFQSIYPFLEFGEDGDGVYFTIVSGNFHLYFQYGYEKDCLIIVDYIKSDVRYEAENNLAGIEAFIDRLSIDEYIKLNPDGLPFIKIEEALNFIFATLKGLIKLKGLRTPDATPLPKNNWRVKTEAEFIEEFGVNWKAKTSWISTTDMDFLFGQKIETAFTKDTVQAFLKNKDKTIVSLVNGFQLGKAELTDKPLPDVKYFNFYEDDFEMYIVDESKGGKETLHKKYTNNKYFRPFLTRRSGAIFTTTALADKEYDLRVSIALQYIPSKDVSGEGIIFQVEDKVREKFNLKTGWLTNHIDIRDTIEKIADYLGEEVGSEIKAEFYFVANDILDAIKKNLITFPTDKNKGKLYFFANKDTYIKYPFRQGELLLPTDAYQFIQPKEQSDEYFVYQSTPYAKSQLGIFLTIGLRYDRGIVIDFVWDNKNIKELAITDKHYFIGVYNQIIRYIGQDNEVSNEIKAICEKLTEGIWVEKTIDCDFVDKKEEAPEPSPEPPKEKSDCEADPNKIVSGQVKKFYDANKSRIEKLNPLISCKIIQALVSLSEYEDCGVGSSDTLPKAKSDLLSRISKLKV